MTEHGIETAKLGEKLKSIIKEEKLPFKVYLDHVRKERPRPQIGFGWSSKKHFIANPDIVIFNKKRKLVLVCEIEESSYSSPKKIIGTMSPLLLGNYVKVKDYNTVLLKNCIYIFGFTTTVGTETRTRKLVDRYIMKVKKIRDNKVKVIPIIVTKPSELTPTIEAEINRIIMEYK